MKLFWRIVTSIYTDLKISGFNLPPYSFLFHKPTIKFPKTIIETVRAEVRFTPRERELILEAAEDVFRFTNKRIKFNITFDLELDEIVPYEENIIMKSHSDEEYIKEADKKYENNVIGLCYYGDGKGKSIYLVTDRLDRSENLFKSTAIHEFGHYLGMTHTTGRSIMQPINSNSVPYPTYIDAVELAKIWKCLPSDLGYFKL